jgi:hypothetical protein
MSRFPPNVEQVLVETQGDTVWLTSRRNDLRLRFPLTRQDALHLAKLLVEA